MRRSLALLALAGLILPGACRRGPRPRITLEDVERCERGIDTATSQATAEQATSTFYRECSNTCAESVCRQAFLEASTARPDHQVPILLSRCSKVYCPLLSERNLVACKPDFVMTPLSAAFGWAELHGAILERDASGYLPRLQRAFMAKDLAVINRPRTPEPPAPRSTSAEAPPGIEAPATEVSGADAAPCAGTNEP